MPYTELHRICGQEVGLGETDVKLVARLKALIQMEGTKNIEAKTDYQHQTPLQFACGSGHAGIVRFLLGFPDSPPPPPPPAARRRRQVDEEEEEEDEYDALVRLSATTDDAVVATTTTTSTADAGAGGIICYANVRTTDSDGYTPLHRACFWGHLDVCKVLVARGGMELGYLLDREGRTPLDRARENNKSHILCWWNDVVLKRRTTTNMPDDDDEEEEEEEEETGRRVYHHQQQQQDQNQLMVQVHQDTNNTAHFSSVFDDQHHHGHHSTTATKHAPQERTIQHHASSSSAEALMQQIREKRRQLEQETNEAIEDLRSQGWSDQELKSRFPDVMLPSTMTTGTTALIEGQQQHDNQNNIAMNTGRFSPPFGIDNNSMMMTNNNNNNNEDAIARFIPDGIMNVESDDDDLLLLDDDDDDDTNNNNMGQLFDAEEDDDVARDMKRAKLWHGTH